LAAYDRWCDEQAEQARLDALAESLAPFPAPLPDPPPPAEAEGPPPYLCPCCGLWHPAGNCPGSLSLVSLVFATWSAWIEDPPAYTYRQVCNRSPN
jgi:hypothetical protein